MDKDKKLLESADLFSRALKALSDSPDDPLIFAGASKCYEVTFEYLWKWFKRQADASGFEVYGPRDSLKAAAQMGIIKDLDRWERFLHARNLSVHDYLGISDAEFTKVLKDFELVLKEVLASR
jgi:nucleotidyltransferase substrate binding protein (TIGR01987 family)